MSITTTGPDLSGLDVDLKQLYARRAGQMLLDAAAARTAAGADVVAQKMNSVDLVTETDEREFIPLSPPLCPILPSSHILFYYPLPLYYFHSVFDPS